MLQQKNVQPPHCKNAIYIRKRKRTFKLSNFIDLESIGIWGLHICSNKDNLFLYICGRIKLFFYGGRAKTRMKFVLNIYEVSPWLLEPR